MAHESSDGLVDEVLHTKAALREQARAKLGVTGEQSTERLRTLLREHNLSIYPLTAFGLLAIADVFQLYAFNVLAPDIARSLGIGLGLMTAVAALRGLAQAAGPLPMAWLAQRRAWRAMLCLVTAFGWSILTACTGLVTSLLGLILILVADGLSTGSVAALHPPVLMDSYHPKARVRVMSWYYAFFRFGEVASPLLVAVFAGMMGLSWRGVFIALGIVSTLLTVAALGLRDPGVGRWDTQRLRQSVHTLHGEATDLRPEQVSLGFFEIVRRLLMIPTLRRLLAGYTIFGVLLAPLSVFITFFLERTWHLDADERGLFFAYQAGASVLALTLYGSRGEKQFRENPAKILRTTGAALVGAVVFIAVGGLIPSFWVMIAFFGAAYACVGIVGPALVIGTMSIVPASMRPHSAGLTGIFTAIGGLVGALLLSSVQEEYGDVGSLLTIGLVGVLGSLVLASAGRFISADLDRMIDEVLEEEEISRITAGGGHMPMLACRGIDFSYGQLQVLFDVDFTVDDGEMVALLGVNGAGKSTLLKVVSGIGLPAKGSVRFRGQDITFLDAERRVGLGITQVPGGKAVFGPLTVVENLRCYGYTAAGDRRRLETGIEECFEAFPRLAQRRNSLAAQLSGGEQQMLALSKALLLRPKLLVIDELSLGLAPVIVSQLLDMVRRINAGGTAVVLVEQSVNIALNLVDHAYFMEKGEMKFDGRAQDLLQRDDLLRAVFLAGAAAADGAR